MTADTPWLWVLDHPRQTFTPEGLQSIPKRSILISLFSSLLSYALADTWLSQPLHPNSSNAPFSMLLSNFGLTLAMFLLMDLFIYQVLKVLRNGPFAFWTLVSLGAVALIPLHLMLPLAIICRPFKVGGLLIYSLGELAIGIAVFRRMAWGLQSALEWPLWAAGLLVLSPYLIACLGVLLLSALLMAFLSLAVLGLVV